MSTTSTPGRPAHVHANYRGDVTSAIGQVVGPNRLGEYLTLVEVAYDETQNRSRAGFTYATTADEATP